MTDRARADVGRRGAAWSAAWLFVALAVLLAPIVAHGCHGDDVDHEPAVPPPVYNQR